MPQIQGVCRGVGEAPLALFIHIFLYIRSTISAMKRSGQVRVTSKNTMDMVQSEKWLIFTTLIQVEKNIFKIEGPTRISYHLMKK